jgi:hypothetical protein
VRTEAPAAIVLHANQLPKLAADHRLALRAFADLMLLKLGTGAGESYDRAALPTRSTITTKSTLA